jgi:LysM repeat protein
MRNARWCISLVVAAGLLAGCTVSYSSSPVSTQHLGSTSPADATMNAIRSAFFTQTAQAHLDSGETPAPLQPTNTPSFATVAPTSEGGAAEETPAEPEATPGEVEATPAQAGTVPTSTPGLPSIYTVREGETIYCIARRFNVDQSELLDINGMTAGSFLAPNDELKIPSTGNPFVGERTLVSHSSGMNYLVKADQENVFMVACYFGDVDPNRIIAANNLQPPYELTAGQSIVIP